MTKREAAIVSAYTGYLIGEFSDFQAYAEEIMGRPIFTHEFPSIADELKEKSKKDFMSIKIEEEPPEWIYHAPKEYCCTVNFDDVEKALGFRLFGWQKSYILHQGFRRMGKTTAEILQMLFDKEQYDNPIDFSEPPRNNRLRIFRQAFRDIWEKLQDAGIEMRPVFWSIEDKKKYEKESMNKSDPYKYAREAFAKYEAENHNYTCSDCSQCRHDDDDAIGVYYCRRSFATIYQPEEMTACDDFEKGE